MNTQSLFKKKNAAPRCSAVIVAAGASARMGFDKIMTPLGGEPVLARTLAAFQANELIDEIIVVTRMEMLGEVAELCKKYGVDKISKVVCGGKTRMESALAGVSEVRRGAKLIAIHDGARPLVTQDVILRAIYAANDHMSAVPVIKSTDTLKRVDDKGLVAGAVDRESVVRVQTPQVFSSDLIKGALTKAVTTKLALTDDCSAIEMMGVKTYTVMGDEDNIKLTNRRDLFIAEAILRGRDEK
ncbi:MAG: 2-C-methyl-D-erythritol 4-phosphate cytidylyltransferase [Oscillospiraceae bacterium]|nr:2-C-methyl-D-erythritol 4-phosphate cytidylyltransferase [Oscillospiraceae bacterium]